MANLANLRVDLVRCGWPIDPNESKNREGRTFPFAVLPELRTVLEEQVEKTRTFDELPAVDHG